MLLFALISKLSTMYYLNIITQQSYPTAPHVKVIYGGFQIGIHNGTRWVTERVPCPSGMQLVMFIPDFIGKTSAARGVLKDTISRVDAAFNIGRVAFLVHALAMGNLDNLKWGVQDRMHQPQRAEALYPHLYPMMKAAEDAGAAEVSPATRVAHSVSKAVFSLVATPRAPNRATLKPRKP